MKQILERLHARMGDFWWYSLMLFCACRAADCLNVFVGLWLVPKYIGQSELGAVTPLANFANFLALPAAAFANTFRNELTRLSVSREFGRLRTLMRGVFVATAVFLLAAIVVSRFLLPVFLERIRIVEGSLGLVIIAASFVSAVAPVYTNALQTLKKFREQSLINVVGAPVRLIAMLVAMPFRALSGYFVGQTASPAFSIAASVFSLRRELSVPPAPYWTRAVARRFATLFALFTVSGIGSGFCGLVEAMVLRQRLPDIDSAGHYMASRFAEIATFMYAALSYTIFPFAAELAKNGKSRMRLILKSSGANIAFCAALAVFFALLGKPILSILPGGDQYAAYWWAIPWLIAISAITSLYWLYSSAEIAAEHFGFMKWALPLEFAYPAALLLVTGHGYFDGIVPASWTQFLNAHNVKSLDTMLWWMTASATVRAVFTIVAMSCEKRRGCRP